MGAVGLGLGAAVGAVRVPGLQMPPIGSELADYLGVMRF